MLMTFLLLHIYFDIPGRYKYEERGWDIPTDPQKKAAYDYAHSLPLPDSVPEPVPFDFSQARWNALQSFKSPDVAKQYFKHLCDTEAGEYVFKTVDHVEGIFQMRPRGKVMDTPIDFDRYALEEPTGVGWSSDEGRDDLVYERYIQPMYGQYTFMERPNYDDPSTLIRAVREINRFPPRGKSNGHSTSIQVSEGFSPRIFELPWMIRYQQVTQRKARYGYTWRGIKREKDRRYGIAGGEFLIIDLETKEILAVKRRFKLSGYNKSRGSAIWWGNARPCESEITYRKRGAPSMRTIPPFIKSVLKPVLGINDEYVPEKFKAIYIRKEEL